MKYRATLIDLRGEVVHRHEADTLLAHSGAAVLVRRGVLRSMVMACPDGCGEKLTINLDPRAGPAWRYYEDGRNVSLFPSVWRDTGCRSHFIVWRSHIYWCDTGDELDVPLEEVVTRVRNVLGDRLQNYTTIADCLGLVPWAVLSACRRLCRTKLAIEGPGDLKGHFKRLR